MCVRDFIQRPDPVDKRADRTAFNEIGKLGDRCLFGFRSGYSVLRLSQRAITQPRALILQSLPFSFRVSPLLVAHSRS